MFKNIQVQLIFVYNMPQAAKYEAVMEINRAIKDGNIIHPIASTFSLDQATEAHIAVESGMKFGTTIIKIS